MEEEEEEEEGQTRARGRGASSSKAMACSQFLIGAREGASGGRWYSPRREEGRPQAAQRTLERCEACRRRAALAVVWAGFGAAVPLG